MDATYPAIARSIEGLQDHLSGWLGDLMDAASIGDLLPVVVGTVDPKKLSLVCLGTDAGKYPEVGADFSLMGRWGGGPGSSGGSPLVPGAWRSLGQAMRLRLERLVIDVTAAERELKENEVPRPRLLPLSSMPKALRAWYEAQPSGDEAHSAGGGWPTEPWVIDADNGPAGRLPYMSWHPGLNIGVRFAIITPLDAGALAAPALSVIGAAIQKERLLRLGEGAARWPDGLEGLVEALADVESNEGVDAPSLTDRWREASDQAPLDVSINVVPIAGAQLPARHGAGLAISLDFPVAIGPRLLPASTPTFILPPPLRGGGKSGG
jgi:hypothetical protein